MLATHTPAFSKYPLKGICPATCEPFCPIRPIPTKSLEVIARQIENLQLAENDVEFLVAPTTGPAWSTDLVYGDHYDDSIGFGSPAAIAGYPHLTVPMGAVETLPVGLSIIGGKWQDWQVLKAGAAYEKLRSAGIPTPGLKRWGEPTEAE